jgi:hypothetical protein
MPQPAVDCSTPMDRGEGAGLSQPLLAVAWLLGLGGHALARVAPDLMGGRVARDVVLAVPGVREGEWLHLLKDGQPYLDRPRLVFGSVGSRRRPVRAAGRGGPGGPAGFGADDPPRRPIQRAPGRLVGRVAALAVESASERAGE